MLGTDVLEELRKGKMTGRSWVIAPYEATDPATFDRVWQFDLANGVITIGWSELGDISSWNNDQIRTACEQKYGNTRPPQTVALIANMLWSFFHEITEDDIVIARRGTKKLAAVGIVKRRAYVSPDGHPENSHANFLGIHWYETPRNKEYERVVFGMMTLGEISEAEYKELIGKEDSSEVEEIEESPENRPQFYMEKYLEEFIIENFDQIFDGELIIWRDEQGSSGQQYRTDVGTIDILAFQPRSSSFVIIELKKGRASDKVVGQNSKYMGWVSEWLCGSRQSVRGLIICGDFDLNLSYAVKAVPNVDLKYYNIDFTLSEIPPHELE